MRQHEHEHDPHQSAVDFLELFGGREDGEVYASTVHESRHALVALTGLDIPYGRSSIRRWLDAGGEAELLAALAEAAADAADETDESHANHTSTNQTTNDELD